MDHKKIYPGWFLEGYEQSIPNREPQDPKQGLTGKEWAKRKKQRKIRAKSKRRARM